MTDDILSNQGYGEAMSDSINKHNFILNSWCKRQMSHVYFQMASSIVVPKYSCWLCPDTPSFEKNRQLKTHMMASPHSCLRVICPWCIDEERSFRGVADLKPHCLKHHAKKLEELSTNFLSEANGIWLCTNPRDYIKLITPTSLVKVRLLLYAVSATKAI